MANTLSSKTIKSFGSVMAMDNWYNDDGPIESISEWLDRVDDRKDLNAWTTKELEYGFKLIKKYKTKESTLSIHSGVSFVEAAAIDWFRVYQDQAKRILALKKLKE